MVYVSNSTYMEKQYFIIKYLIFPFGIHYRISCHVLLSVATKNRSCYVIFRCLKMVVIFICTCNQFLYFLIIKIIIYMFLYFIMCFYILLCSKYVCLLFSDCRREVVKITLQWLQLIGIMFNQMVTAPFQYLYHNCQLYLQKNKRDTVPKLTTTSNTNNPIYTQTGLMTSGNTFPVFFGEHNWCSFYTYNQEYHFKELAINEHRNQSRY